MANNLHQAESSFAPTIHRISDPNRHYRVLDFSLTILTIGTMRMVRYDGVIRNKSRLIQKGYRKDILIGAVLRIASTTLSYLRTVTHSDFWQRYNTFVCQTRDTSDCSAIAGCIDVNTVLNRYICACVSRENGEALGARLGMEYLSDISRCELFRYLRSGI